MLERVWSDYNTRASTAPPGAIAAPHSRDPMPDISKRLEKADKYLQKGKPDSALDEYLGILEEDPRNESVRLKAADLCVTLNRTSDICFSFSSNCRKSRAGTCHADDERPVQL